MTEIRPGQLWQDNNDKNGRRVVRVVSILNDLQVEVKSMNGRKSTIKTWRFGRAGVRGLTLVEDVTQ